MRKNMLRTAQAIRNIPDESVSIEKQELIPRYVPKLALKAGVKAPSALFRPVAEYAPAAL